VDRTEAVRIVREMMAQDPDPGTALLKAGRKLLESGPPAPASGSGPAGREPGAEAGCRYPCRPARRARKHERGT